MRSRGVGAFRGNRCLPKGRPAGPGRQAIAVLRQEIEHSHEVMMAAIGAYKDALKRYRATVETRFRGEH